MVLVMLVMALVIMVDLVVIIRDDCGDLLDQDGQAGGGGSDRGDH